MNFQWLLGISGGWKSTYEGRPSAVRPSTFHPEASRQLAALAAGMGAGNYRDSTGAPCLSLCPVKARVTGVGKPLPLN
jgi:hypothetical protein